MTRILVFAGSARKDSLNARLANAAAQAIRAAGADATLLDMRDYEMPLYDGDLEADAGLPENARRFKKLLRGHDGFLVACPEYNGSVTPLFKNTIDWASRAEGDEKPVDAFEGQVAAVVSASPGALGGLRGLVHARQILANIGVLVVPGQLSLGKAHEAFGGDGALQDNGQAAKLAGLSEKLVAVAKAIPSKA